MAQSKSFFGLRTGSTKSLTFQVLNGKQITKDRVYNVKNPQSIAQMQQRALMATAVTAYSKLKEICDHSFEGVEVGSKSMAEFIKLNLAKLSRKAPEVNITEYKSGVYANNNYIVSKGSLVPPAVVNNGDKITIETGVKYVEDSVTWGSVASSLGIKKGGMLTFMVAGGGQCTWLRIKFNNDMWDTKVVINQSNISQLSNLDAIEGNSLEFESILSIAPNETDNDKLEFNLSIAENEAVAAIISEKTEGVWKRSTAELVGTIEFMYEAAFATYPINTTLLLNGGKMSTNVITK